MQKIEDYIKTHRKELDSEIPPERIWESIDKKMNTKKINLSTNFWKAAAIFALICTSIYLLTYIVVRMEQSSEQTRLLPASLASQEQIYLDEIQSKMQQIIELESKGAFTNPEYKLELDELSEMYLCYSKDLLIEPENEQAIMALTDYYEKKILLLNTILLETQKLYYNEKFYAEIDLQKN